MVSVHNHSKLSQVKGGVIIEVVYPRTTREWCAFYGVSITKAKVILFKAVDKDFKSKYGTSYVPGTKPSATDWDGGEKECGGGLHFSPHPSMALEFFPDAVRFVACPLLLTEIVVHKDAQYPQKVKAPRVFGPIYEVDRYGNKV